MVLSNEKIRSTGIAGIRRWCRGRQGARCAASWLASLLLVTCLSGCVGHLSAGAVAASPASAAGMYQAACTRLRSQSYQKALDLLTQLTVTFPTSPEAERARLAQIYVAYRRSENEAALSYATEYIHLYPRGQHVDYAYYMQGYLYFISAKNWFNVVQPHALSQHDLTNLRASFSAFTTLLHAFPHSVYAKESVQYLLYLREVFAEHEWQVARFYLHLNKQAAAIDRAKGVIRDYASTPQAREAATLIRRLRTHMQPPAGASASPAAH